MTLSSLAPKFPGSGGSKAGSRFILELFVILCLCVCYYFLVRNFTLGVGNNYTNNWVFTACSKSTYHLDQLYEWWKGRLSGMLLSGALFDLLVKDGSCQVEQFAMVFGLYQAFWLLVLMLTMLVAVRESLLVNLGIFAGLLYNCFPGGGLYFYPWDLPATVFLTLAVLLHERGQRVLMLAAICVGCFFKETVLVGVILCLFNREWKWHWRILGFAGPLALYFLGERCLFSILHLKTAVMAVKDPGNLKQLLHPDFFVRNLGLLFSDITPQVLFANAGTLVAVLVVGWKRRFRPYMWMMVAFVAGHYLRGLTLGIWQGMFSEVRVLIQVLPLSCLILSEYAQCRVRRSTNADVLSQSGSSPDEHGREGKSQMKVSKSIAGRSVPEKGESAWASRKSSVGLIVMAVVMMVISVSGVVLAYNELSGSQEPEYQARMLTELRTRVERGEAAAQYALGNLYYRGVDGVVKNRQEAVNWYREAADRGHTGAQLMLGLCYLHGEGTAQNYEKSIPWLRKVAAQGNQKAQFYLGLDYAEGSLGVKRDMTDHFQYLAWLGPLALAAAGLTAVVGMVRKRKSIFDPALCMAMVLAVGALSWRWRYGGVEKLWQNTIVRDPNYYLACRNLGNALIQTGQEDKAQACLQKAVELDPDDANTHYNLGVLLTQKGQLDEAIIHYRKAAELQPDYAEAHNNLGYALAKKGQLDEAIVHYRKAAELQPDYAQAHNNLGYALVIKGQWDGAIRQYQEALRLQPDFAKASNNLVVVLGLKAAAAKQPASSTKP